MSKTLITNTSEVTKKRSNKRSSGLFLCDSCKKEKIAQKMSRYISKSKECKVCHIKRTQNPLNIQRLKPLRVCPVIKKVNKFLKTKEYKKNNKELLYKKKQEYRKNNPSSRKGENQFRERTIGLQKIAKTFRKEIVNLYKNCPEGYQIDHIIPILHKNICGLHVPWNMQYLTPIDNNKKNNKWDGTYNNENWKNK